MRQLSAKMSGGHLIRSSQNSRSLALPPAKYETTSRTVRASFVGPMDAGGGAGSRSSPSGGSLAAIAGPDASSMAVACQPRRQYDEPPTPSWLVRRDKPAER